MSAETPSAPARIDATPRVDAGKPALRVGLGRYTVDVLPGADERGVEAIVSNGQLGDGPIRGRVGLDLLAGLVAHASFIRAGEIDDTAAWPLVAQEDKSERFHFAP